jgi:hypothetical protein
MVDPWSGMTTSKFVGVGVALGVELHGKLALGEGVDGKFSFLNLK